MTRKTKIGIAMGAVVVGALAIGFGPGEEEGTMSLTYAGVSANDSNQAVFTITNSSRDTLAWYTHSQVMNEGSFSSPLSIEILRQEYLKGRSTLTFESPVTFDKRWRVAVWYDRPLESFVLDRRAKFARFAYDHTWYRLGKWIEPDRIMLWAYGPEMLGNKPAPLAQK